MSVKQPTANNVISLQCKIFSFGPIKKFPSFKHDSLCAREIKLNPPKKKHNRINLLMGFIIEKITSHMCSINENSLN